MHHTPRILLRRRTLTYMELLIALSITACVAGILSILISSTAAGTNASQDGRRGLVRTEAIKAQVGDALANARSILAVSSSDVAYWIGDQSSVPTAPNNAVNLSELRLLELDASGNLKLYSCQWPNGFSNPSIIGADQTYATNTSWMTAALAAKTSGYFTPTLIASNVTAITPSLDNANPTAAKLIQLRIDITENGASRSVIVGSTLQSPSPPS